MIPFNKPVLIGKELEYIQDAVTSGRISGDGKYTRACQHFLEDQFGFPKVLLTTSCTDALEMISILLDLQTEDEIIIPSFAYVSTANAFALRGAQIKFADVDSDTLCISAKEIKRLLSPKTKAVVLLHYAGVSCDVDAIKKVLPANKTVFLIEDNALGINSKYNYKYTGTLSDFSAYSFHQTKNIMCGEGGALCINNPEFIFPSEVVWQKGTDRNAFDRKEKEVYTWQSLGSSFLPSEMNAAYLKAQLENIDLIQEKRVKIWETYQKAFEKLEQKDVIRRPIVPKYATVNGSIYYLLCKSEEERDALIRHLKERQIQAVFHYQPLHLSPFFLKKNAKLSLTVTEKVAKTLIRLPIFYDLTENEQASIIEAVETFYTKA